MTGTTYTVPPIPPDPEHTVWIDAGPIMIGVEHRLLDDAELADHYQGEAMDEIQAATGGDAVEDNGVSLHVMGSEDGHEYLRFDLFEHGPHYHYIDRSCESQTIIDYDRVALGPMLPWALGQIRDRLSEMLIHAGGDALVEKLDVQLIQRSLGEVEKRANEAEAELAAQRPGAERSER